MNYVRASDDGIEILEKLQISVRLMNEIHAVRLKGVRGASTQPGLLRTEQVWIGPLNTPIKDARFIPPPAPLVRDLLLDLEHFVNEVAELPPLVQC